METLVVRLTVPEPPRPPPSLPDPAGPTTLAQIDLSLERAAIAREQAHLAEQSAGDAIRAEAVRGWIERGYEESDAKAAVAIHGADPQAAATFLHDLSKLRDEYGIDPASARAHLSQTGGDVPAAVSQFFHSGAASSPPR